MNFKLYKQVPMGPIDGGAGWCWVPTGEEIQAENRYAARHRGAGRLAMPAHMVKAIPAPLEEITSVSGQRYL